MMRHDILVYISGPLTAAHGRSIEDNIAIALRVYFDLLNRGIPAFCPHAAGLSPSAWSVVPYDRWLEYDLAIIDRCTHVLMLSNWSESKGATLEFEYAVSQNKIIISTPVETITWPTPTPPASS